MSDFRVKRCTHLFCRFDNKEFVDLHLILAGQAKLSNADRTLAISLLTESEVELTRKELETLAAAPQKAWVFVSDLIRDSTISQQQVLNLAEKGLLITDLQQEPFNRLREQDRQMATTDWHPHAALFHFMSKWREEDLPFNKIYADRGKTRPGSIETIPLTKRVKTRGMIPNHFYARRNVLATIDLPVRKSGEPLFDVLTRRHTCRQFDPGRELPLDDFSKVLYYTFGCHGLAPMTDHKDLAEKLNAVKRTSPSGGALTPVECYLLINRVEGLEPGLYHYNMERHALEYISGMDRQQAESMAEDFTSGQTYYANAHVQFILTARFYRNFWKYGNHKKAYKVILLDAAHLSQTLYLVCTELKLGVFVTAAIHDARIEKELKLDKQNEGVILIAGCGIEIPGSERHSEFQPRPYDPEAARSA